MRTARLVTLLLATIIGSIFAGCVQADPCAPEACPEETDALTITTSSLPRTILGSDCLLRELTFLVDADDITASPPPNYVFEDNNQRNQVVMRMGFALCSHSDFSGNRASNLSMSWLSLGLRPTQEHVVADVQYRLHWSVDEVHLPHVTAHTAWPISGHASLDVDALTMPAGTHETWSLALPGTTIRAQATSPAVLTPQTNATNAAERNELLPSGCILHQRLDGESHKIGGASLHLEASGKIPGLKADHKPLVPQALVGRNPGTLTLTVDDRAPCPLETHP